MKKELLQKLIDDNTIDGVVDYDAVFKVVDKSINDMAKLDKVNTEEFKAQALKDATKQVIESLKLEDTDNDGDLDKLSKTLTDKMTKLEDGLKDYTTKFETQEKQNATLQLNSKLGSRYETKYIDFARDKYTSLKTDDNTDEEVYAAIEKDYPEFSKGYKPSKGNDLPDHVENKKSLSDQMAEAMGVTLKK